MKIHVEFDFRRILGKYSRPADSWLVTLGTAMNDLTFCVAHFAFRHAISTKDKQYFGDFIRDNY